jgi:hypothetical protein
MSVPRLTAIALTAAALAAAGCGADGPTSTAATAKPTGMPIQQYVDQVADLGQPIDDARSDYFHADHTRAAIRRGTVDVQAAYASAVSRLATIDPPAVAADLHRQLEAAWRKRATQLGRAVATKPFDTARVDDLMAETGRDVSTAELYSLPQ